MTLKTGDLVTYETINSKAGFELGLVIQINLALGLVKIRWANGSISLHAEMFLKRIA